MYIPYIYIYIYVTVQYNMHIYIYYVIYIIYFIYIIIYIYIYIYHIYIYIYISPHWRIPAAAASVSSCCLKRECTRSGYSARALKEETNQQSPGPLGIYQYILCTYHITMIKKKKNMYQIISYNVCIPYKENIYIYLFIYSLYIIYIYNIYILHVALHSRIHQM